VLFEKTELKGRTGEERCSYFLLLIGEKGREIHKTLTFAEPETETGEDGRPVWKRTTEQLRKAFREFCSPQKNVTYERHKFNIRNQTESESIDQYVTELRTLASTCEFENLKDGLIRDRVICGIRNQALEEGLLREASLTLKSAVDICRAAEVSRELSSDLNSDQIFDKYAKCFEGVGRISEPYHIKLQPDAIPVVHPPRKLPVALRNRVFDALNDMESKGIIKPVT
jgi:hypothetical protein